VEENLVGGIRVKLTLSIDGEIRSALQTIWLDRGIAFGRARIRVILFRGPEITGGSLPLVLEIIYNTLFRCGCPQLDKARKRPE
jgi:hypothetical protein